MILALGLLTLSGALLLFGPSVLARWGVGGRPPLAGLVAWQVASWSVVVNIALAAALLASPSLAAAGRLPTGLESCLAAVRDLANPADSRLVQAVAAALLGCLLMRLAGCAIRSAAANYHDRARHRAVLSLVARRDTSLGAHVVPDRTPIVYCLPGRGGRVVFTSAAVQELTAIQRAAVVAHERAHLRGRHHLFIASASLLTSAFPRVRLFSGGFDHTAELVEMRADDLASRGIGRRPLAEALLALAGMGSSTTVLAASAVTTAARIERLLTQQALPCSSRLRRMGRAGGAALSIGLLAASPVILAAAGHAMLCLL